MPTVLSARKQQGAVKVELDDGSSLCIPAPLFRERPLRKGDDLDICDHHDWMRERGYGFALDAAVAYLAARSRTTREVEARLERTGYDDETRNRVVARLTQSGYLNDAVFAEQWTRSRNSRALGARRIAMELQQKGIDRATVAIAVLQLDVENQLRNATMLAQKILSHSREKDPRAILRKAQASLARRGYSWDIIRAAVESANTQTDDPERDV